MVIWHWKDSRLPPMQQVQENQRQEFQLSVPLSSRRNRNSCGWPMNDVRQVTSTADYKYRRGHGCSRLRAARRIWTANASRMSTRVNLETGERKLAVKKSRWVQATSPDGTHILYYDDGAFFTFDMPTGQSYNITKDIPSVFYNTEDDHNVVKPPERPIGWSKDSSAVLLSDGWDIWKAPRARRRGRESHGQRQEGQNPLSRALSGSIRTRKASTFPQPIYVGAYGEWTKKGGIGVIEPGKPGSGCCAGMTPIIRPWRKPSTPTCISTRAKPSRIFRISTRAGAKPRERPACDRRESAAEEFPVVEGREDDRLHQRQRRQAARRSVSAGQLRAGQELSDHRLHLRKTVAGANHLSRSRPSTASTPRLTPAMATRC